MDRSENLKQKLAMLRREYERTAAELRRTNHGIVSPELIAARLEQDPTSLVHEAEVKAYFVEIGKEASISKVVEERGGR